MQKLTVSILQNEIFWEDTNKNLQYYTDKIATLKLNTNILILPEVFNTGFSVKHTRLAETMQGKTLSTLKKIAKNKNIIIVGSLFIKEEENYFNRMCWVYPNESIFYYDKKHLFAYIGEDVFYKAGNKRLITSVNGWKINSIICYDLRFPVWIRNKNNNEYDILFCIANWPAIRISQWKKLLMARAIENQCFVVGVNRVGESADIKYNGNSLIINPLGDILFNATDKEELYTYTFEKENLLQLRNNFNFGQDADNFIIIPPPTTIDNFK